MDKEYVIYKDSVSIYKYIQWMIMQPLKGNPTIHDNMDDIMLSEIN